MIWAYDHTTDHLQAITRSKVVVAESPETVGVDSSTPSADVPESVITEVSAVTDTAAGSVGPNEVEVEVSDRPDE